MTYAEFKNAVIIAYTDDDKSKMVELRSISPKWYDEIVSNLESLTDEGIMSA